MKSLAVKEVVIVIPVYNASPPKEELASFRQCLSVLKRYDIALLTYKGLDCTIYETIAENCSWLLKKEYFDAKYFSSVNGYNSL